MLCLAIVSNTTWPNAGSFRAQTFRYLIITIAIGEGFATITDVTSVSESHGLRTNYL